MKYLPEIARLVNSGRCWAIVGAGASCELGMPSWGRLAEGVLDVVKGECPDLEIDLYNHMLEREEFASMFSLAATDLGGIEKLCQVVDSLLVPTRQRGELYRHLARWPFAGYLTTNYDDYLKRHLDETGIAFTVLGNTADAFRIISAETSQVVVHIHGTTADPDNIVLTSRQYTDFITSPKREYFRKKLEYLFTNHKIVILGYSLSDPDLQIVLDTAQHFSAPDNPIYMIAADVPERLAQEMYETRNLRVLTYPNESGDHSNLSRRILPMMDRFIAPRVRERSPFSLEPLNEEEAAASLYVYSRGQLMDPQESATVNALEALVLRALSKLPEKKCERSEIATNLPLPTVSDRLKEQTQQALDELTGRGLVTQIDDESVALTEEGMARVAENEAGAELLRTQILEQLALDFSSEFEGCEPEEPGLFAETAVRGLDGALRRRGLTLAACSLGRQSDVLHGSEDLLEYLRDVSNELEDFPQRAFFVKHLADCLEKPTDVFRRYIARQSQGYFAFHVLGLHEEAAQLRREWLDQTVWILDSSVILPLLARDSNEHPFANDLFERVQALKVASYTTEHLFEEVVDHARWALSCIEKYGADSTEFMMIATLRGATKQNLFIDGFIQAAAGNPALSFESYMSSIFGTSDPGEIGEATIGVLNGLGVVTERFSEWNGFSKVDWGDLPYWTSEIRADRERRGTFRNIAQCEAEAEVLIILLGERDGSLGAITPGQPSRAYFVTRSGVLRRVSPDTDSLVWSPEALYRYLLLFPTDVEWNDDAVFELIRSDLYLAGMPVINELAYATFFNPRITESNLRMEQAAEMYGQGEASYLARYTEFYDDQVPELEKPFYSLQVAWDTAQRERARADRVVATAPLSDRERRELESLRMEKKHREREIKHKRRSTQQKVSQGSKSQRKKRKQRKKRRKS